MIALLLLLFAIGAAVGGAASLLQGARTHVARFNNVLAGILGALAGGVCLPRWLPASGSGALLLAIALPVAAIVMVALIRHRLMHSRFRSIRRE